MLAAVKSAKCHRTDRVLRRRVYENNMKIQAVELWMRTIILLRTTRTGNMKRNSHSLVEEGEEEGNRVTYRQNERDIGPITPTEAKITRTLLVQATLGYAD